MTLFSICLAELLLLNQFPKIPLNFFPSIFFLGFVLIGFALSPQHIKLILTFSVCLQSASTLSYCNLKSKFMKPFPSLSPTLLTYIIRLGRVKAFLGIKFAILPWSMHHFTKFHCWLLLCFPTRWSSVLHSHHLHHVSLTYLWHSSNLLLNLSYTTTTASSLTLSQLSWKRGNRTGKACFCFGKPTLFLISFLSLTCVLVP